MNNRQALSFAAASFLLWLLFVAFLVALMACGDRC